jgi:asparagine synthase (glutamine-hydrolysing)
LLPDVFRVRSGHAITIDASGEIRDNAWCDVLDHLPKPASTLNGQAAEFRTLLLDACERCLRSDASFAIEQSGGLDSGAIACSVAALDRRETGDEQRIGQRRAFIACTPIARHDEYLNARIATDYAGATLERVDLDDRQALDVIERVIFDHETIFGFPRIGAWMLYRAMGASGIRVSLAGLGVDDTLGSDTDYVEAALDTALKQLDLRRYRDLHRVLRGMAGGNVDIGRATARGEMYWLLRRAAARLQLLDIARRVFGRQKSVFLHPRSERQRLADEDEPPQRNAPTPLDAKRFRDFQRITPLYLANFDRASAAHGIDVRFPFMDRRLVAYAFALPEESRNGDGYTKRVLRQAMAGMMPDAIRLHTRKTAFTVPLDEWSRGALKPWLLDLCASRAFIESDVWHGPTVRQAVESAVAGDGSLYPVWPILQAYALERAFVARAAQPTAPALEAHAHEMAAP